MGHLIDFIGENESDAFNLNLLYQIDDSNIYIMDNHLAASWCWSQEIDFNDKYSFFHFDQHLDLNNISIRDRQFIGNKLIQCFENESIDDLIELRGENGGTMFIWDNFIALFKISFPNVITDSYFGVPLDKKSVYDEHLSKKYESN